MSKKYMVMNGNTAAAYASYASYASTEVAAIFPIMPSFTMAENPPCLCVQWRRKQR